MKSHQFAVCATPSKQSATQLAKSNSSGEKLWHSRRLVPEDHIRLSTGQPFSSHLASLLEEALATAALILPPNRPYRAPHFVGLAVWAPLDRCERIQAGHYLTDLTRRSDSRIGVLTCKGRPNEYFWRYAPDRRPNTPPSS